MSDYMVKVNGVIKILLTFKVKEDVPCLEREVSLSIGKSKIDTIFWQERLIQWQNTVIGLLRLEGKFDGEIE